LRSYDPAYFNTASVTSRISYIDGDKGILNYRGYPIEQLAEKSTFLEVSYLLIYGELPDKKQLNYFTTRVMRHTFIHEDLATQMKAFRYDAHPMGMLISTLASMSTVHPEANPALAGSGVYKTWGVRNKQIHRILGGVPTVAAYSYRHRIGRYIVFL
jgi:citrate synthase